MRLLASLLIAACALVPVLAPARPAVVRAGAPARAASATAAPASATAASPRLLEPGHYRNVDGAIVHSPAHTDIGAAPPGASAQCRDATYSFSTHRRGTCSHHGGVARWL